MRRYPSGFLPLCAAIVCERFSFFLLLALLLLYLNDGVGFGVARATDLVGFFVGTSYLTPLAGGLLGQTDYRRTAALGCLVASVGYGLLMLPGIPALSVALALVVFGSGVFKSATQALADCLYTNDSARRDGGFSLIYSLVNISGVSGPIVGEAVRCKLGWSAAFAIAMLGMIVSYFALLTCKRSLSIEDAPEVSGTIATTPKAVGMAFRLLVCLCGSAVLFTVAHMQTNSILLLWARDHTERRILGWEVPVPYFAAVPAAMVLGLAPLLSWCSSLLRRCRCEPATATKMAIGLASTGLAFVPMVYVAAVTRSHERVSMLWLLLCMLILTFGEMLFAALGPSLVTRLAPPRRSIRWLGAWFAATAIGYGLAGQLGGLWGRIPNTYYFVMMASLPFAGTVLLARRGSGGR